MNKIRCGYCGKKVRRRGCKLRETLLGGDSLYCPTCTKISDHRRVRIMMTELKHVTQFLEAGDFTIL